MPAADIPIYPSTAPLKGERNGLTIRHDSLYTDAKGRERSTIQGNSEEMLDALDEIVKKVLEPGETIFFMGRAQVMPGVFEQLALGWHVYALPRVALVLTDRRIVALRVRGKFPFSWRWDRGIRSIRWADLTAVKQKGLISKYVSLRLRRGEKISFWRISRSDGKRISAISEVLCREASGQVSASGAPDSLCPACLSVLTPAQYHCASCHLPFKDQASLIRRGILIPGGASFYVGQKGLGLLRALVELLLLLVILSQGALALIAPQGSAVAENAWATAAFFLFVLLLDKLVAILVCRRQVRDFLPEE